LTRRLLLGLGALLVLAVVVVLASAATDQPHRYFRDEVVAQAPCEVAWGLVTAFDRYDAWNPYLVRAAGRAVEGAGLSLDARPPGEDAEELDAEVIVVRPGRKLEWETRTVAPGVLDHEQIFRTLPAGPGRCRIVHEARFEGVLAPLADVDGERRGLAAMIAALARRAEADYQSSSE
jgi:hypothetical protein